MKSKFLKRKKYQNPFLPRTSRDDLAKKKKKKRIFILFILIAVLAGLIYLVIYSPVFKIKKIVVSGTRETELVNRLQIIIRQEIEGYKYLIWPKDNIILLNKQKLKDRIRQELVLDKLEIDKKLLNSLKIEAEEKIPVLLWQENEEFYYVDRYGVIMAAVPKEEVEYDLTLISRGTTTQVVMNQQIIKAEDVEFIKEVLTKADEKFKDWKIAQVVAKAVENDEIFFYSEQGWYFLLTINTQVDKYLDYLDKLLIQKIEDRTKLEYVDLRIEDKIFYKEKE